MAKKRGKGDRYDQVKTVQINLLLTPTAAKLLADKIASYRDASGNPLSRCEFFERFARNAL